VTITPEQLDELEAAALDVVEAEDDDCEDVLYKALEYAADAFCGTDRAGLALIARVRELEAEVAQLRQRDTVEVAAGEMVMRPVC
jgi:hypothetical protein